MGCGCAGVEALDSFRISAHASHGLEKVRGVRWRSPRRLSVGARSGPLLGGEIRKWFAGDLGPPDRPRPRPANMGGARRARRHAGLGESTAPTSGGVGYPHGQRRPLTVALRRRASGRRPGIVARELALCFAPRTPCRRSSSGKMSSSAPGKRADKAAAIGAVERLAAASGHHIIEEDGMRWHEKIWLQDAAVGKMSVDRHTPPHQEGAASGQYRRHQGSASRSYHEPRQIADPRIG